ncbi:MAG: flagellar FliJ family protein [Planctomycetota bacterium]
MTAFRFSLQALLDQHQHRSDKLKASLQRANNAITKTRDEIAQRVRQRDQASLASDAGSAGRSQIIDSHRILEVELFRESLQRDIDALQKKLDERRSKALLLQKNLAESQRKLESLKHLRQQQFASWQEDEQRREQTQLDEFAAMAASRRGTDLSV